MGLITDVIDGGSRLIKTFDSAELGKVLVELKGGVNDASFEPNPPIVRVLQLKDKTDEDQKFVDDLKNPKNVGSYISYDAPPELRTLSFHIPFDNKKSKKKAVPKEQLKWILAVPDQDWINYYDHAWYPVQVVRGQTIYLAISLTPKDPGRWRTAGRGP